MNIKVSEKGITDFLKGMLDRSGKVTGWLNRVAYPELIKVQRRRWQTENVSEGVKWKPLNPSYAKWKRRKYADFPGSGSKLLIATGRLAGSMTGDNREDHYKLVKGNRLEMGSMVPYAKYVEENGRDITSLSDETVEDLVRRLRSYIVMG